MDGPNSLPLKIDAEQPNLGKLHATRRVARTIYMGSAPTAAAAHRGLEGRRVKLEWQAFAARTPVSVSASLRDSRREDAGEPPALPGAGYR